MNDRESLAAPDNGNRPSGASAMIGSLLPASKSRSGLSRLLAAATCAFGILLGASACSSSPAAPRTPLRILIEFREPVDGAAPDLVSRLERLGGLSIRYAAPVSAKLHAYELFCPARDPDCAAAIRSLRKDPAVLEISPDQLRKTLPTTR
jgi:hypothetical protein